MTVLSTVTGALERCWTGIRTVHGDVREAAIVVYLHPRGDRRGHFWGEAWTTREAGKLDEVHVSSHILQEGAESVFRTLLHEACHSIAESRDIQEVSRQGRYHNKRFRALAEELGLETAKDPRLGWVTTGLTDEVKRQFRNPLEELRTTLDLWQTPTFQGSRTRGPSKSSSIRLVCPDCSRIIRASAKSAGQGPIICDPCGTPFLADDKD